MKEAKFFKTLLNERVQCQACNHFCVIEKNKVGECGVRQNKNGKLFLSVYGYPAATNVDPIEKKPFFHFLPGSSAYSLGTFGCNFHCDNCQNWSISQKKISDLGYDGLSYMSPERIVEEALDNDCASIAYTYNEPSVYVEYALDTMKLARKSGLKNVWVSNGYFSEKSLEEVLPYMDAINVDLKSFDDSFYRKNCKATLDPVLKNLKIIKSEQPHIEITTLIIPGLSDNLDMLNRITNFISDELDNDVPWHLSKFSPKVSWHLGKKSETGEDIIYEAYEIGKEAGLKYVYVGNMPGDQRENTYCSKCNELAIRRFDNNIERLDLDGFCPVCEKSLDIIE